MLRAHERSPGQSRQSSAARPSPLPPTEQKAYPPLRNGKAWTSGSAQLWREGQTILGPNGAAVAFGIAMQKHALGETDRPGAYFAGIVEAARAGRRCDLNASVRGRPKPTPPEAAVSVVIVTLLRITSALKDVSANREAQHLRSFGGRSIRHGKTNSEFRGNSRARPPTAIQSKSVRVSNRPLRSAPEPSIELLDQDPEVAVNDGLGGFDLLDLAIERLPAHPLGLFDVVTDAAVGPETMTEFEGTPDRPVVGTLALRFVASR